jgi:hypothetical protein
MPATHVIVYPPKDRDGHNKYYAFPGFAFATSKLEEALTFNNYRDATYCLDFDGVERFIPEGYLWPQVWPLKEIE